MEIERFHHDADEIDHCVKANDDDAILYEEPSMKVSGLLGARIGWSPPSAPKN